MVKINPMKIIAFIVIILLDLNSASAMDDGLAEIAEEFIQFACYPSEAEERAMEERRRQERRQEVCCNFYSN